VPFLKRGKPEDGDSVLRLYYASDIHGTELLWREFLNAPRYYKKKEKEWIDSAQRELASLGPG